MFELSAAYDASGGAADFDLDKALDMYNYAAIQITYADLDAADGAISFSRSNDGSNFVDYDDIDWLDNSNSVTLDGAGGDGSVIREIYGRVPRYLRISFGPGSVTSGTITITVFARKTK